MTRSPCPEVDMRSRGSFVTLITAQPLLTGHLYSIRIWPQHGISAGG